MNGDIHLVRKKENFTVPNIDNEIPITESQGE
jgi:hypothetical protein